jgi:hypothetical protein
MIYIFSGSLVDNLYLLPLYCAFFYIITTTSSFTIHGMFTWDTLVAYALDLNDIVDVSL